MSTPHEFTDEQLAQAILALLAVRRAGATICPSEVARAVAPDRWRPLMVGVRRSARSLARRGAVELRQRGARIPPDGDPRGPIRIALAR